ncbi:MAG: dihydrolipoyl dehydrogenase [Phycisphaerales bacterium]|nr:MAG: dihydrolipoyl dehydrogenase [Phycisphaerales bacterium]
MMAESFDVVVVGAGPGGFRAARRCAQNGASVAVVEQEYVGGTCLNWGCIPSKVLLASAHVLLCARNAAEIGIDIPSAEPNWAKIQQRKEAVVAGFRKGMTATAQAHKMRMIQGRGVVTSPNRVVVDTDGQSIEIEAGKLIIATGSKTIELANIPFDGRAVINSKDALSLEEIPKSMVVIGGGVIGCEMACVYAAMGTKVTITEALEHVLPMEDQWVARQLEREFKKIGIDVIAGHEVASVDRSGSPARVLLDDGRAIEAEKVLVSVGRKAFVGAETVEALGLEMDGARIVVNARLETNVPGVYALGDVVGTTYLAHGAFAEGEVAAVNVMGGDMKMKDYALVPRVIFTFPEVASVGKSEEQCKSEGLEVTVGKGFFKANGRSVAHNQTAGQVRVVRENKTNRILGVTIVGDIATELIAFAADLIGRTAAVNDITFPHPTVSETFDEAVEDAFGADWLPH